MSSFIFEVQLRLRNSMMKLSSFILICFLGISASCHNHIRFISLVHRFQQQFNNSTQAGGEYIQYENQNVSSTLTKKIVEDPIMNKQDSTLPNTTDNSSLIVNRLVKSVQKDQCCNQTSPENLPTQVRNEINNQPSSAMSQSNGS